jgi:16S rRNA (adenine1518-N6/adenine1519-N6)-dimethyltransferase
LSHKAKKRFGQNFLHDQNIIRGIVAAIHPQPGDRLVEIGPGLGALTAPLLEAAGRLDVVELDRDLIPHLEERFADNGNLHIHHTDALKFDFCSLAEESEQLRVAGNLPYNISTPLIFHLIEQAHCIRDMHFMLQKEVVERLAAAPGGKDYGRLSIMVQYHCRVEKLFNVPPGAFTPSPKVDSAIVRLTPYKEKPVTVHDEKTLSRLVAQAFNQRRKTLRNNLKPLLDSAAIEAMDIDPGRRPETITLEEFARLADRLSKVG